jgi:hypothetical protein
MRNMRKKLLASLLAGMAVLFLMPTAVHAEEPDAAEEVTYHLKVVHTDGSEVKVPFDQRPEIAYTGNVLKLTAGDMSVEYAEGEMDYFTIVEEKGQSGINRNLADRNGAASVITDRAIVYSGGTPGAMVTVVGINGAVVARATLDDRGNAVIPFTPQKGQIYVVNSGKTTFKIIKK